jgi:hypothetical protein
MQDLVTTDYSWVHVSEISSRTTAGFMFQKYLVGLINSYVNVNVKHDFK